MFQPTAEEVERQLALYRGSYWGMFSHRVVAVLMMQTCGLGVFSLWRVAGAMLMGMALMKWRVLAAECSRRFYTWMVVAGYGIGLPLAAGGAWENLQNDFDIVHAFQGAMAFNYLGSLLVAAGHIGVVMLVCQAGWLRRLRKALAAVGQMALTNYLLHTVLCTAFFYGWGLGWFGYLQRLQLLIVVAVIWTFQLLVSPVWLRYFRYGPMEWLWRSLTYWRWQPMRNAPPLSA
jgi:uncharacterized protein